MFDAMKNSRKEMANVNSTLENSITGIRETKAYVAHNHEKEKFAATNEMFAKYRSQSVRWIGIYSSVMELLTDVLYLVIIFIGGVFMIKGKLNAADFTAFLLYINMFINPIHRFVTLFEQLQEGMSGFSRFYEIITTPDELDEGTVEINDIRGDIAFENVTFSYAADDCILSASDLLIIGLDVVCKLAFAVKNDAICARISCTDDFCWSCDYHINAVAGDCSSRL